MPETAVIAQFERRLLELGCPSARAHERARELADHHDDLRQAALDEGCSEADAVACADARLGNPATLAESLARSMRQGSWWGRHPVIGFCALPVLTFIPAWLLISGALFASVWAAGRIFGPAYLITDDTVRGISADRGEFLTYSSECVALVTCAVTVLMSALFCWLARKSVSGWKWMLVSCGACSFAAAFSWMTLEPHTFSVGFCNKVNSGYWWIPLSVAAVALCGHYRLVRRFANVPRAVAPRITAPVPSRPRRSWLFRVLTTPTYWVAAPAFVGLCIFGLGIRNIIARGKAQPARVADLRARVWPVERRTVMDRVKACQTATESVTQTPIDLRAAINASLATTTSGRSAAMGNDLSELPAGVNTYGGVRFDVEGTVQLMGLGMLEVNRLFPAIRRHIPVARKCARLHLLEGAIGVKEPGVTIANLVLRYADGSTSSLAIVSGEDILDWTGSVYQTPAAGELTDASAPRSGLAWIGTNAWLGSHSPDASIRLFRTTFANPRPEVEISSIDYASTLTAAAPFMAGLTLDSQ